MNSPVIRAQLERMLGSRTFAGAGRQAQFLRFIIERAADRQAEPAKEYTIAVDLSARGSDYNPQIDSPVRVEARAIDGHDSADAVCHRPRGSFQTAQPSGEIL